MLLGSHYVEEMRIEVGQDLAKVDLGSSASNVALEQQQFAVLAEQRFVARSKLDRGH